MPTAPAEGDAGPSPAPQVVGEETYVEVGDGSLSVVDGSSEVYGTGPLKRFIVEVEDGIDVDGAGFAAAVASTLGDPRSWGNGGQMSFQRVGADAAAAGQFEFKVSLVSPGHMETYCPGVGTGGYTSCRYGDRAVINLARWATAVPDYQGDIATYRLYVVNHEVGHVLGHGHEPCPGTGQRAPVMQQQTLGLEGCTKNAWPYPMSRAFGATTAARSRPGCAEPPLRLRWEGFALRAGDAPSRGGSRGPRREDPSGPHTSVHGGKSRGVPRCYARERPAP